MIINRDSMLMYAPITDMRDKKIKYNGFSFGMSEAGYDIRIAEDIWFTPPVNKHRFRFWKNTPANIARWRHNAEWAEPRLEGNFCLASALEEFSMPKNLVGIVHDKSTWARRGLSVFNTVIEPGWKGFLTLELVFNGSEPIHIEAGTGIAQVVFHQTSDQATYEGKYQNQEAKPQEALYE